jgi:hypothetical protein
MSKSTLIRWITHRGKSTEYFIECFKAFVWGAILRQGLGKGRVNQLTLARTRQFHICAALYQATAFGDVTLLLN